ncbi:MAG: sulfotransferase [Rhodothermaceae bacterium]|nr:sulfotransferase [Rhodothermaceae bacterium]MXX58104.1 sulfotransferase [Rhodothermaceae bacterium]MYD18993.1 sulfotransferase [Rhodothermaceae bacterium]MYD55387.1 sulfotransferase [Rhodothermaceae bacterium]MYI43115.1 sulfotransferase [Rhodothermaceae bacterium]
MTQDSKKELVTSTDYSRPYRPFPVRAYNRLGRIFELQGNLEPEELIINAQKKTGLADLGDEAALQSLDVLLNSINNEARLNPLGKLIQKSRFNRALIHRLRIEELLKKHPEIHEIDLGRITLITGLQRTGTTLLQRLLNSNPAIRALSSDELLEPVPTRNLNRGTKMIRKFRSSMAHRAISYLSPDFRVVHPISKSEPEEDVLLLDLYFMSQSNEATMNVPTYARWLEKQNHTHAYEYFKTMLKILSWQHAGKHWVLKTPHHMEYLDVFLKTFPNANIIQIHRDPRKTLPSFCSMVAHGRGIFSDHVNPEEIASHWHRKVLRMIQVTETVRSKCQTDRFLDVSYYSLIADPIEQLQKIYQWVGMDFDDQAVKCAEQYIKTNPKNRFGRHSYCLEDFGLIEEDVEKSISGYRQKYKIPFE